MATDNIEEIPSQSFYVHNEFPFVFIPSSHFAFANNHSQVYNDNNPMPTEVFEEGDELEATIDHQAEENEETNDLRISQPKYSQLLKDLDFSETRMYDVTQLLSDETGNDMTVDEKEDDGKIAVDANYQSLPSACSTTSGSKSVNHRASYDVHQHTPPMNENENSANDMQGESNVIHEVSSEEYDNQPDTIVEVQQQVVGDEEDYTQEQEVKADDQTDAEQEPIAASPKCNVRFAAPSSARFQNETLSSIPRLNPNVNHHIEIDDQSHEFPLNWSDLIQGADGYLQSPTVVIFAQPIEEIHTPPPKQPSPPQEKPKPPPHNSPKQKSHHRSRQFSASSETDSVAEYVVHRSKHKQHSTSQPHLSIDEDYNDLNSHLKQAFNNQSRPYTSASDILLRRLSNQQIDRTSPSKKKSHHQHRSSSSRQINQDDPNQSINNDTWLFMLEKLEREHKERLEKQQKQYEAYMQELEEKMKRRFEEYLSSTNSLHESKSESVDGSAHFRRSHDSFMNDSIDGQYRHCPHAPPYRQPGKDFNHHHCYPSHNLASDKRPPMKASLARSQSREDISILRTELSTKHAKHISDLKLYYEHEIEELKNQLNTTKMGHTSSSTRQSLETIERITNDNLRLQDEIKDLRHSQKLTTDENSNLKRQLEELRNQMNTKDFEFKNHQRTIVDLQQQINEARNIKDRQDEKMRYGDQQALLYRQENEKMASDLNLTRERLLRLEERYRDLENENKTLRQSNFGSESNTQRNADNHKYSTTIPLNMPTSREYGRFSVTTSRYSTSTMTSPRAANLDSARYASNDSDDLFRHSNSPRPLLTLNDYINEKPKFPPTYAPASRPLYSPRKSPNLHSMEQIPDLIDTQMKQSEQLEEKFDELLKKKRDLEARINRIPMRGLAKTDRQLFDVLEREIERVDQQISSVKLELRKLNILRTH